MIKLPLVCICDGDEMSCVNASYLHLALFGSNKPVPPRGQRHGTSVSSNRDSPSSGTTS